jgi:Protein of unknown function (DUF3575)
MNTRGWIGALCLACGLGMEGYAQEPLNAVKVGYSSGFYSKRQLTIGYEHALKVPGSVQIYLGGGFRTYPAGYWPVMREYSVQGGIDFRFFYALRRGKELSGAYVGPYLTYLEYQLDVPDLDQDYHLISGAFLGINPGYQYAFAKHFRADAGVRIGYGYPIHERSYSLPLGRETMNRRKAGSHAAIYFQIGYAF